MALAQSKKQINKSYRLRNSGWHPAKFQFNSFARQVLDLTMDTKLSIRIQTAGIDLSLGAEKDGIGLQQNVSGTFHFNR